jgi:nicotinate phosphoribosyltransferase
MTPSRKVAEIVKSLYEKRNFPWDFYFMAMAEADWREGSADLPATKSYFIRKAPFGGSYCLLGGITDAIVTTRDLRFDSPYFMEHAVRMGSSPEFVDYLAKRERLRLKIVGGREGAVFFPHEPIVSGRGSLLDMRLFEGIMTYSLNYSSLSLTKWFRVVHAAHPGKVMEFSLRRSQNSRKSSFNAMLAGCFATSNCDMAEHADVLVAGTMGHEYIQSHGSVELAFDRWLEHWPMRPVGLIDTVQTLQHDFPLWLDAVYKHRDRIREANPVFWGWRNDSGDLGYLAVEEYRRFMNHPLAKIDWFRDNMFDILTNELDEYRITNITNQIRNDAEPAGLDVHDIRSKIIWAPGTRPGVCEDQPSLGGVMKLMEVVGYPTLKPALDSDGNPGAKTSIPGYNHSCLMRDAQGNIACCLIYPARKYILVDDGEGGLSLRSVQSGKTPKTLIAMHKDSRTAFMELPNKGIIQQQRLLFDSTTNNHNTDYIPQENQEMVAPLDDNIEDVTSRIHEGISRLHFTMTSRLENPYPMKVSVPPDLFELREDMLQKRELIHR